MEQPARSKLLPWIAAAKLLKAALLFTVALGFHDLKKGDAEQTFDRWVRAIRVDPDNVIAHKVLTTITGLPEKRLHQLGLATFFYALLFATEGTGLAFRQTWAEYLTILSTMLFLPLEVWELKKPEHRGIKAAVLALNLLIVAYLIWNLARMRKKQTPQAVAV
jgi:uncharacterized membrane protein (DUF2068 family)